jgi:hypothetical protein
MPQVYVGHFRWIKGIAKNQFQEEFRRREGQNKFRKYGEDRAKFFKMAD